MIPSKLKTGDLVAIISPSQPPLTKYSLDEFKLALSNFEKATGLKTVLSKNALAEHYYSAGTIEMRLEDFNWAIKNPDVKAVIFSVGGNTAIELVDKLDYELIRNNPKIICGISDATTLLNPIYAETGLVTFLGVEFTDFAIEPMDYEVNSIRQAWFEGRIGNYRQNEKWRDFDNLPTRYKGWQSIKPGIAEGKIIGGNFSSFAQLFHTQYMPELSGNILVMECYKYSKRDIHNALARLKFWGAFEKISGLVIGYCLGSDEASVKGNDRLIADLANEVTNGYNFPVMQIGEIGHNVDNLILPIGAKAKLDSNNLTFEVLVDVTK